MRDVIAPVASSVEPWAGAGCDASSRADVRAFHSCSEMPLVGGFGSAAKVRPLVWGIVARKTHVATRAATDVKERRSCTDPNCRYRSAHLNERPSGRSSCSSPTQSGTLCATWHCDPRPRWTAGQLRLALDHAHSPVLNRCRSCGTRTQSNMQTTTTVAIRTQPPDSHGHKEAQHTQTHTRQPGPSNDLPAPQIS